MPLEAAINLSPLHMSREIGDRLDALRKEIAAKRLKLAPLMLTAEFSAKAAAAKAILRDEIASLVARESELTQAKAEADRQIEAEHSDAEAARQEAKREEAARIQRDSHLRANNAAADLDAASRAFIRAARALSAELPTVSGSVHAHASFLPRRMIRGIAHELRSGAEMEGFEIRDVVDHWDAGFAGMTEFRKAIGAFVS